MAILIGVDEAGYGPNLGPLCVAACYLVINPGAAGPARFGSKPRVALLALPDRVARIVALEA